ncbi:hypothetical protein D0817_10675 [Flavobacterium cupreum]|uniref:Protein SirB1 N-terminal domain-containing protein n=1 Tax=Flavobacterium cupreum TaxID=2133766 RepID=A0A434A7E6_9FLAO|nr:hypothetical protein [Flavobacterium cupreum]RUT70275.1 hypothetical protein D0817_10675 [Flavobacterium cupreum]
MKKYLCIIASLAMAISATAQDKAKLYEDSFTILTSMVADGTKYNFKEAVFSVENAYLDGKLDTVSANREIKMLKNLCNSLIKDRFLAYVESDKKDVNKWASVYQVMCDSIPIVIEDKQYKYVPFVYDFNDVFGNQDISSMFVSKLLYTRKGNCHSLPYLYKILCEELGTTAHLALAPNHIYIKHQSKANGWYNTELTSGIFPNDSWLMASGFVHLDAIKNGVYMKALNNNESIALVIIDLANAYQKSFPENDGTFLLKCADVAIKTYPNFATALILKAELHKKLVENEADTKKANADFKLLEKEYAHIHQIGYRFMPEEMYLNWLVSLKTERDKYENKKLNTFNKQ